MVETSGSPDMNIAISTRWNCAWTQIPYKVNEVQKYSTAHLLRCQPMAIHVTSDPLGVTHHNIVESQLRPIAHCVAFSVKTRTDVS